MINWDMITNEINQITSPHRPQIPDYSYRILIIGGSRSRCFYRFKAF